MKYKFKIGDRVKLKTNCEREHQRGMRFIIRGISDSTAYCVHDVEVPEYRNKFWTGLDCIEKVK